ncbi:MAG: class I SAM-dependent RNA methyltransferase [Azospirillaceae bacterium]
MSKRQSTKSGRSHRRRPPDRPVREGPPLTLGIARLGGQGDGIADTPDGPVYVDGALPGEQVRVQPGAPRGDGRAARLLAVLAPAPERMAPPCPHAEACGGCRLQHLAPEPYRAWKRGLVIDALSRRGIVPEPGIVMPLITVPRQSRRRVTLAARRLAAGVVLGFNARGSATIVDIGTCLVARPEIVRLLAPLRALIAGLLAPGAGLDVAVTVLDDGIDMAFHGAGEPDLAAREALAAFAGAHDLARVSWVSASAKAPDPIAHRRTGIVGFNAGGRGFAVALPPGGFLQATVEGERLLQAVVGEAAGDHARVVDLFAGAGTFAAPLLAGGAHVLAVDSAADGLAALDRGARRAGHGERLTTACRDLFDDPLPAADLRDFDAVVFDPPRAGAAAQSAAIARSGVPVVVAVSCNPASFARDARLLVDAGYRMERLVPVDQFLWTGHLELAAVFRRGAGN